MDPVSVLQCMHMLYMSEETVLWAGVVGVTLLGAQLRGLDAQGDAVGGKEVLPARRSPSNMR